MRLSLLTSVILLAVTAPAQRSAPALDLRARIAPAVEAFRDQHAVPGLGCAVWTADGTIVAFGSGLADLENDVPVTERTVFRLASISKPFTAVTALRLMERGELDLDQSVHELVADWPVKQWSVTPRLLLGHLGGVRHYARGEIDSNLRYPSVTAALSIFASDPLEHEPGTKYRYTTYGYNLLGAAIESAAQRPFAAVLRTEVLEPSGCATLFVDDSDAIIPHRAQGYRNGPSGPANSRPVDTSNKIPGGGLCSTPTDLVRFAGAILGGELLGEDSIELMWTPMRTRDGTPTGYGMGWRLRDDDDHRIAYHTGAQPRVSTILWIDRNARVAVAVMTNLEGLGVPLRRFAPDLVARVLGD